MSALEMEIAEIRAEVARNTALLEKLVGGGMSKPVGDVGLKELQEMLGVGTWRPCMRTVKEWTRKHRATLYRVTTRPVSYSRESVKVTLETWRAGKAGKDGRRRM
jgi:hypothetical protein